MLLPLILGEQYKELTDMLSQEKKMGIEEILPLMMQKGGFFGQSTNSARPDNNTEKREEEVKTENPQQQKANEPELQRNRPLTSKPLK